MRNVERKLAFVLASTNHGPMILNCFDYQPVGPQRGHGVGSQLLERAVFDPTEVEIILQLLERRGHCHAKAWWRSTPAPISACTRSSGLWR